MARPIEVPEVGHASPRLSAWHAEVGDELAEGERVAELLIPGATVDLGAPAAGRLTQRLAAVNDRLEPGQVLGLIEPPDGLP